MADKIQTITTKHEGMIHDVQYDYYGQHMASCSSDGTVRVCTVHKPEQAGHESVTEIASWQAHNGPVWQIGWAHPKFGRILASCGFDKKVIIWTETNQRDWREVISFETESSINAISFAPWECGLKLLACGIDGSMFYISRKNNDEWEQPYKFQAHSMSVNSVSWGALNNGLEYIVEEYLDKYAPLPKFATASCDKSVKIWEFQNGNFVEVACLTDTSVHTDYIRDVAWCPKTGPNQVLASCSEDGYVIFWSNSKAGQNDFCKVTHKKCEGAAWRLSWSPEGSLLAVSVLGPNSENIIELYKENGPNSWNKTTKLEDY